MRNREALLHLWKSIDKDSIYQLSYIRNLANELGEKELYFMFKNNGKTDINDYTEQEVVDYTINVLVIKKTRKRYYLDNRNYLMHVLYHKFKWTEDKLQDLFLIDHSTINHNKYSVMNLIETKDAYFFENTKHLFELFPINFEIRQVIKNHKLWEKRNM